MIRNKRLLKQKITIGLIVFLIIFTTELYAQIKPQLVFVKGGSFRMGNNRGEADEKPVHTVILSNFYIGKYEITVAQYQAFCKATGKNMPKYPKPSWYEEHTEAKKWVWKSNYPIAHVTWNDAMNYCKWLSQKTGQKYSLPTEAQWEYAARGGQKSRNYKYSGSNNINRVAWYDETTYEKSPRPVGTLRPNEIGINDMSGNVWEWCYDRYGKYVNYTQKNPTGPKSGIFRVIRGGSWYYVSDMCLTTSRDGPYPFYTNYNYGFRVVRIL